MQNSEAIREEQKSEKKSIEVKAREESRAGWGGLFIYGAGVAAQSVSASLPPLPTHFLIYSESQRGKESADRKIPRYLGSTAENHNKPALENHLHQPKDTLLNSGFSFSQPSWSKSHAGMQAQQTSAAGCDSLDSYL